MNKARRAYWHRVFAWVLLIGASLGWPASVLWFAKHEPQTVLHLSWFAIWLSALTALFAAGAEE